jgi:hypothetical protein
MISSSESPPTFNSRLGPNRVAYVRCTTPRKLSAYTAAVIAKLRDLAPYAAIELVLPGGSLMALLLWLYRSHKARHAWRIILNWVLRRQEPGPLADCRACSN